MADALRDPAYSTSVGLLRMGLSMESGAPRETTTSKPLAGGGIVKALGGVFKRLLPDGDG